MPPLYCTYCKYEYVTNLSINFSSTEDGVVDGWALLEYLTNVCYCQRVDISDLMYTNKRSDINITWHTGHTPNIIHTDSDGTWLHPVMGRLYRISNHDLSV